MIPVSQFREGLLCVGVSVCDKEPGRYEVMLQDDTGVYEYRVSHPLQVGQYYLLGFALLAPPTTGGEKS